MGAEPRVRQGMVLALACAAQFMVVLDVAIVNVALPSIQEELDVGQNDLQWIIIGYGLMLRGFLLLGGRLADLLGRRRILLTGLVLFSAASLLAGLAESAEVRRAAAILPAEASGMPTGSREASALLENSSFSTAALQVSQPSTCLRTSSARASGSSPSTYSISDFLNRRQLIFLPPSPG